MRLGGGPFRVGPGPIEHGSGVRLGLLAEFLGVRLGLLAEFLGGRLRLGECFLGGGVRGLFRACGVRVSVRPMVSRGGLDLAAVVFRLAPDLVPVPFSLLPDRLSLPDGLLETLIARDDHGRCYSAGVTGQLGLGHGVEPLERPQQFEFRLQLCFVAIASRT